MDGSWLYPSGGQCIPRPDGWAEPPPHFHVVWLLACAVAMLIAARLRRQELRRVHPEELTEKVQSGIGRHPKGLEEGCTSSTTTSSAGASGGMCAPAPPPSVPTQEVAPPQELAPTQEAGEAEAVDTAAGLSQEAGEAHPGAGDVEGGKATDTAKKVGGGDRLWHLDFARVVCVFCVVHEHTPGGGNQYSHHNDFFVLNWVMPFLYITSGISFMMSRRPLHSYLLRLVLVFLVGCLANAAAFHVNGQVSWRMPIWQTMYQMGYVLMLIIAALFLEPLRRAMRRAKTMDPRMAGLVAAGYSVVPIVLLIVLELGFEQDLARVLEEAIRPDIGKVVFKAYDGFTPAFLGAFGCAVGASDLTGWVLIVFICVVRIVVPYDQLFLRTTEFQLYVWAMVVQAFPLRGSGRIARWVHDYWPLWLCVLFLCINRDEGRCDLYPSESVWQRCRFYIAGEIIAVTFVSGGLKVSDPNGEMRWLNRWSLYAFMFHVFWARVLPPPWGGFVTCASAIFFKLHDLFTKLRR